MLAHLHKVVNMHEYENTMLSKRSLTQTDHSVFHLSEVLEHTKLAYRLKQ